MTAVVTAATTDPHRGGGPPLTGRSNLNNVKERMC
jgi:hypothetical protein